MIQYQHPDDVGGFVIYRQYAKDLIPDWAVNVRPFIEEKEDTSTGIPGEEGAYLHFTLNAFKEIVEKYGANKVCDLMDEETNFKIWEVMVR